MKKTVKTLIFLWAVFLIVVVVANLFTRTTKLEMIQHGEMEKSSSFEAIVIRDETLIYAKKSGVLESMVKDNELVRKNKLVASLFESKVDGDTKAKLANVNMRIEEITRLKENNTDVLSTGFVLEGAIGSLVEEMMNAIDTHDMEKVVSIKNEINILSDKKNVWEKGEEYSDEILETLLEEKRQYEQKLGNAKEDLYSPVSGIYTTNIDGYEEVLSSGAIGEMTYEDFESIKNMKPTKDDIKKRGAPCKIIDNFNWSLAFGAKEEEISKLKKGSLVYIRNNNYPGEVKAKISYISPPSKGKYIVIVTSDVACDWAMKDRFVEVDLIKKKYEGLKVPIEALRVKDGETGVYVVVDGIVKFKKINVLYKDTKFLIAEENNASGGLLLYDEVIVSPGKYKEGSKIS